MLRKEDEEAFRALKSFRNLKMKAGNIRQPKGSILGTVLHFPLLGSFLTAARTLLAKLGTTPAAR
jgi:hypothetical protein